MQHSKLAYLLVFLSACSSNGDPDPQTQTDTDITTDLDNVITDSDPVTDTDDGDDDGPVTFDWVTGQDTSIATSGTARPALNVPFVDEDYGTTITRVTDASQVTDNDFPTWVRQEYSRRPAFNVDSTRAIMHSSNGWLRLYSVDKVQNTMTFVRTLTVGGSREPNWHPTNPDVFYYLGSNGSGLKIYQYNVATNEKGTVRDLESRVKAIFPSATNMWTKEEGRPSNDGNIWCFQIETEAFAAVGLLAYRFDTDQVLGSFPTTDRPDHISTSPKGNYCVPSWVSDKGTRAYNLTFSSYTQLHTASEHSDLAVTKDGKEVYVQSDYSPGPHGGNIVMTDMATGTKTDLVPLYGPNASASALHISGTAMNKPGYVVVSYYACTEENGDAPCEPGAQWFEDKIVVLPLEANATIYNVAHTHRGDAGYWAEPTAVANRDLTKILFTSTWESTSESNISAYMIAVPPLP